MRHLISLEALNRTAIERILDMSVSFKELFTRTVKKVPALRGKTVVNLFFENSTRTRNSFELAAKRLSADVLNFSTAGSSTSKGETLLDTARTIEAMASDIIVIRHGSSGAAETLSRSVKSAVVNAGDGTHEHPTQGLLDIFTILEKRGRIEGLAVAIVGDIKHSRVARSNIQGLLKLGARVILVGPPTLVPRHFKEMGVEIETDLDRVLPEIDAINMLRIQRERMETNFFPSIREYAHRFGLTEARLAKGRPDLLVLHPGPMNRGTEIAGSVADGPRSVINEQVTNGVAVRMAVLYLVSGGELAGDSAAEEGGNVQDPA